MPTKILYVEDNAEVRGIIAYLLGTLNYHVIVATNGVAALELLDQARFDLVMTDLDMPMMSGLELAQRIKVRNPSMPVVLLTAMAAKVTSCPPQHVNQVDLILPKPITLSQLRDALQKLLCHRPPVC